MIGKLIGLTMNPDKSQNLTITINEDFRETYDKLSNVPVTIDIKKVSSRRSQDANSYLWHLCGEIAKASSKYSTDGKNEIYREAIKAKGIFQEFRVKKEALSSFMSIWSRSGTGWFVELIDDYVPDEYSDFMGDKESDSVIVHAFFGSSVYDSMSMSHVIDYVVMIANDLGIPTMTEKERNNLITAWGKKVEKNE